MLRLPGVQSCTSSDDQPCRGIYSIDGRDWSVGDTSTPTMANATQFGIATCQAGTPCAGTGEGSLTYEQNAEAGFDDSAKRGYVQGKDQTAPASTTTGLNTIAPDSSLNPTAIQSF